MTNKDRIRHLLQLHPNLRISKEFDFCSLEKRPGSAHFSAPLAISFEIQARLSDFAK